MQKEYLRSILQQLQQGSITLEEALARLVAMIRQAAVPPKYRRPTRPTLASKTRRLEGKTKRSGVKKTRGRVQGDGD